MTDTDGKPFYLLGAGFSKAVNPVMPLLDELSQFVLGEMRLPASTLDPFDGNLEQWLSHISADQPWLTSEENLQNRARFEVASRQVFRCIRRSENAVFRHKQPSWLGALVDYWCDSRAHVATFNYDVIIERSTRDIGRVDTWRDVYAIPLTDRTSVAPGFSFGGPAYPKLATLSLYKLHGSTSWMYGGFDSPPSEPIVLNEGSTGWDGDVEHGRDDIVGRYRFLYDDVQPLIVPPTGSKGAFYGNRALRAQWRKASENLKRASELVIIGYSFPPSDLAARHFVSTSLRDRVLPVTVVDWRTNVAEGVRSLLPPGTVVDDRFAGESAVSDYVATIAGDCVEWGLTRDDQQRLVPYLRQNDQTLDVQVPARTQEWQMRTWFDRQIFSRWPSLESRHSSRPIIGTTDGSVVDLFGYSVPSERVAPTTVE